MELIGQFYRYFKVRRKFWLAPILVVVGLFGGLLVLTHGTAVAPFIYTLF